MLRALLSLFTPTSVLETAEKPPAAPHSLRGQSERQAKQFAELYRADIVLMARITESKVAYPASTLDQIRVCIEELIKYSYDHPFYAIRILTGSLSKPVYTPQIIEWLDDLAVDRKVSIICADPIPDGTFKRVKYMCGVDAMHTVNHFMVIGNVAYRFEGLHNRGEQNRIPSRICFNDVENGEPLASAFDKAWSMFGAKHVIHNL